MKLFVSEYVCGGAWPEPEIAGSLATEGRAMLTALLEDFARIPGVTVSTTWDRRLGPLPVMGVQATFIHSVEEEQRRFEELARTCDSSFVVAPEFQGILTNRCRVVERNGGRLIGPTSAAVGVCADKLSLCRHLRRQGIPMIETQPFSWGSSPVGDFSFPIVIKPRDGAGSQDTYLIRDPAELESLSKTLAQSAPLSEKIRQPFLRGKAVSVAMILSRDGERAEVFQAAEQTLSDDRRFRYLGGIIPARCANHEAMQTTALTACRSVRGLHGYVGVDLIVSDDAPEHPVVVEINPRLTTSYLGYRALTAENLAERMLFPARFPAPIVWRASHVKFDAAGRTTDNTDRHG